MQNVKTRSTLKAIFFTIITLGLYYFVWLYKLVKDLNALDIETTKKLSYWKIISVLIIILFLVEIVVRYFFNEEILPSIYYCFSILEIIFFFKIFF